MKSVCYAWNKTDFTREAFRILKPGGRIVVADFFSPPVQKDPKEDRLMQKWTDSWAIKSYAGIPEFTDALQSSGFDRIIKKDITQEVKPSIRRLFLSFFPGIITTAIGRLFGIRNRTQTKNTWSTDYQYQAHNKDLWRHCIFSAEKPNGSS